MSATTHIISVTAGIVTDVGDHIFSAEMTEPAVALRPDWVEDFVLDEVSERDHVRIVVGANFTVTQGLRTAGGTKERFSRISFVVSEKDGLEPIGRMADGRPVFARDEVAADAARMADGGGVDVLAMRREPR